MGVVREMMVPGIEGDPTGIEEPSEYPAGTAKVYIAGPSEMGDGSTMMSCLSMHTSWWGHSLEYHCHCHLVCSAHIVTPSLQLYEDESSYVRHRGNRTLQQNLAIHNTIIIRAYV